MDCGSQTTADQLRDVLAQIRRLLDAHPKVDPTSARARFIQFSGASLDLEIFAYVLESEQTAFLAIQEDLLLGIMDIIDTSGASVAAPVPAAPVAKGRRVGRRMRRPVRRVAPVLPAVPADLLLHEP